MINIDKLNIINPNDKRPAPGQYFFLVFGEKNKKRFVPAVAIAYASGSGFYGFCKILGLEGLPWEEKSMAIFILDGQRCLKELKHIQLKL